MEYLTKYPKSVSFIDGIKGIVKVDGKKGVEELQLVVKKNVDELLKIFSSEGFTKVKFEHKKPSQIGHGFSLKLKKPWELHVRLVDMKKGLIAIQAEVEVSRDYFQHLFSQNTPVIYEIEEMLKKHQIDYKIWNMRIKKYINTVFNNYKIQLSTPAIPVLAWKPFPYAITIISALYLIKYIQTI